MHFKRLLLCWLSAFATTYGINILMVTAWNLFGYNNIFLTVGMVNAPLIYLFFGWIYFRGGFAKKISTRLKDALVWIFLDFLAGMAVLKFVAGLEPKEMFTTASYLLETGNLIALLLAGYLRVKHENLRITNGGEYTNVIPPLPKASPVGNVGLRPRGRLGGVASVQKKKV